MSDGEPDSPHEVPIVAGETLVVKKLGPSLTAGYLMDWEQDWAEISADAEKAIPGPCFSRAGCEALRLVTWR